MTLHQHLRHTGGIAEVAVDLEGRMGSPQVTVGTGGHQLLYQLIGTLTVHKPCPGQQPVADGPAGSAVAAEIQCGSRRIQPGLGGAVNGRAGIKSHQLRNMAVQWITDITVVVLLPVLLDLAGEAHVNRV